MQGAAVPSVTQPLFFCSFSVLFSSFSLPLHAWGQAIQAAMLSSHSIGQEDNFGQQGSEIVFREAGCSLLTELRVSTLSDCEATWSATMDIS